MNGDTPKIAINVCRGVAYYKGGEEDQRLFYSAGSWLYCVDALTGMAVPSWGDSGRIDLHHDLEPGEVVNVIVGRFSADRFSFLLPPEDS